MTGNSVSALALTGLLLGSAGLAHAEPNTAETKMASVDMTATPLSRPQTQPDRKSGRSLRAGYTVYVGGFLVARGTLDTWIGGDNYKMRAQLGAAGLPAAFWDGHWDIGAEGAVDGLQVKPQRYVFVSRENDKTKTRLMSWDASGMPETRNDPPEGKISVLPGERRNTRDPVSALLVPVAGTRNPCDRTIRIFDGKRRYDIKLSKDRETEITTRDRGYSGHAIVCKAAFTPKTGTERKKFTQMLRRDRATEVWLAPLEKGRLYLPIKLKMRTPIGGAVLELVSLEPHGWDRLPPVPKKFSQADKATDGAE
ncbi:hypothetical protein FHS78_002619 [Parvibaculum indicum]|uniref:DUF3108 domain-containing protein n=1 Tax=Parvibaculum indicum TaxID=562969 RepID=UPI00141E3DD3|nr:DUF3108 domain-containing protein [Parvibaculum indicum]NIJ42325.1 hypothetical protein [Parvibaculum indicum]